MFAYLTVNANNFAAMITSVGEDALVTFGAVRIIFFEEISEDITNTDAEHILKTLTCGQPCCHHSDDNKESQSPISDKLGHWSA
jgi:hypothetical protein